MTMRAMMWAFALEDISPTAKLIAITIADHCLDDSTGNSAVSFNVLFEWAGGQISHGDLDRALAELVTHGLRIKAPDHRNRTLGAMADDLGCVVPV